MNKKTDILINIEEASKILGVSKDTLRNWDNNGKLKSIRTVGKHRRYERNSILEMVKLDKEGDIINTNKDKINDKIVVYAYICGDIFHKGHLSYLKNTKSLGDFLVVGVLTDEAVMEKKKKPIICFEERIELVRELKMVDIAVPQYTYSPYSNVRNLKPDILVESTSHDEELINESKKCIEGIGGKLVVFSYYPYQSSTNIKNKIKESKL